MPPTTQLERAQDAHSYQTTLVSPQVVPGQARTCAWHYLDSSAVQQRCVMCPARVPDDMLPHGLRVCRSYSQTIITFIQVKVSRAVCVKTEPLRRPASSLASGNLETQSWEEVAKHSTETHFSLLREPHRTPHLDAGAGEGTGTGSASALITAATSKKWGI